MTAVVALESRDAAVEATLIGWCKEKLAAYKAPKRIVFVDEIVRSPSGKADYRWAKQVASA